MNYCSQWKTAAQDCNQGISTSFISNKNMGVISLNEPLLGFSNIYQYGLNVISSYDSYTTPKFLNLRRHNKYKGVFIPGNIIDSETRYGYNELLIDRYLFKSKDNDSKVMPDYVLFFKLDDKYKNSQKYRDSLQCAKDFGIDLVIIDFNKVLDNELKEINDMEEELFKSPKVNKELLSNIMDRYMSNISGLRTFCGSPENDGLGLSKNKAFVNGLDFFVDDIVEVCSLIDDDKLRLEWMNALNDVYLDEKRKHQVAISVSSYHCSIGHNRPDFLLDDIGTNRRVNNLFAKYDSLKIEVGDLSCESLVLINLFESLGIEMSYDYEFDLDRYTFKKNKEISPSVEEKLVIAYLIGNYEDDIIEEFNDNIDTKFRFGVNLSLEKGISSSSFAKSLKNCYDRDKLNSLIDKVENISDMEYLSIVGPYINEMVYMNGYRRPDLMVKLLSRKNNICNEFNGLNKEKELVKRK